MEIDKSVRSSVTSTLSMEAATPASLPAARVGAGFMPLPFDRYDRIELGTSSTIQDEIFASLTFLCDVEKAGREFVARIGQNDEKQAELSYSLFQGFVRQAETFFSSAGQLHHRASPLLFYYAFLNLAKACIALRNPSLVAKEIGHGLRFAFSEGDFQAQAVQLRPSGVFPTLYELTKGTKLPENFTFNIASLLAYVSDVGFEYQRAGYGESMLLPVRGRGFIDKLGEPDTLVWPVIAVLGFEKLKESNDALRDFYGQFEEVDLDKGVCERVLGMRAFERLNFRFFQGKTMQVRDADKFRLRDLVMPARRAIQSIYMPNVFRDDTNFFFAVPLQGKYKFDELLAGYVTFFYLGSLVRYRPDYLERILHSRDSWMIERFTKACSTTLLRHFSLILLQENRVLFPR